MIKLLNNSIVLFADLNANRQFKLSKSIQDICCDENSTESPKHQRCFWSCPAAPRASSMQRQQQQQRCGERALWTRGKPKEQTSNARLTLSSDQASTMLKRDRIWQSTLWPTRARSHPETMSSTLGPILDLHLHSRGFRVGSLRLSSLRLRQSTTQPSIMFGDWSFMIVLRGSGLESLRKQYDLDPDVEHIDE